MTKEWEIGFASGVLYAAWYLKQGHPEDKIYREVGNKLRHFRGLKLTDEEAYGKVLDELLADLPPSAPPTATALSTTTAESEASTDHIEKPAGDGGKEK